MEIRNGEYIRTNDGYIRKIIEDFSTDNSYFKLDKEKLTKYEFTYFYSDEIFKKEIKNHSFNIIDLIEEGDYVNGVRVNKIERLINEVVKENYIQINGNWDLYSSNINSVLTKEQFKAMEYEIK